MARDPSLESLRVLEACVRHGSFTNAAAELRITPAAVSARIRNLEADLGATLFERRGPHVTATKTASALAAKVAAALGLIHTALGECRAAAPQLRLTAPPSFATRWLAPRLGHFHALQDAPKVALDVSSDVRDPRSFDVAIRTGEGPWPDFEAIRLFPVEATPMMHPSLAHELRTPADLARITLIPHPDWPRWFAQAGFGKTRLVLGDDDYPTHEIDAAAALAGAGAALLSPILYADLLREGRLVQPFAHTLVGPAWHYALLQRSDERPGVARFAQWLLNEAAARPPR